MGKNIKVKYENIEKIRDARKKKGLSQYALAKLAGVSRETVQGYESGRKTPTEETVTKLCRILDLDPSEIIGYKSIRTVNLESALGPDTCPLSPLEVQIKMHESGLSTKLNTPLAREAAALVLFRKLNDVGQFAMLDILQILSDTPKYSDKEQ